MTGIVGTRYILEELTKAGMVDVAFGIATQTDKPSWGQWVKLGYTSLPENWGESIRSLDHHMFGSIGQWFFEDLAGVEPLRPGYAEIEFRPEVPSTGLDAVEMSLDSVRGMVATSWRKTDHGFALDIVVPPGSKGLVHVPAEGPSEVSEVGLDRVRGERAEGVRLTGTENGRVVYRVESGTYRFRVGPR
jgi:alpha-L-rhamnosidase